MGLNMEGDMTDYSGLMVLFLLLPVVVQIIIPLLMLVGFGLIYLLRTVLAKRTIMNTAKFDADDLMELQSSRSWFIHCQLSWSWLQYGKRTVIKKDKEICGDFTVETEDNQIKQVLALQDLLSHYSKEENYSKTFCLDSLDGVTVYKTENPTIFRLANGTLLKRKKWYSYIRSFH